MRRLLALLAFLVACASTPLATESKVKKKVTIPELIERTVQIKKLCIGDDGLWSATASGVILGPAGGIGSKVATAKHVTQEHERCIIYVNRKEHNHLAFNIKEHPDADLATFEVLTDFKLAALEVVNPQLGMDLLVVGYPFDLLKRRTVLTLTTGMLAAKYGSSFRMTAHILPGSSGGPVYERSSGHLVGIVSSYLPIRGTRHAYDGHYYAVPSALLPELK